VSLQAKTIFDGAADAGHWLSDELDLSLIDSMEIATEMVNVGAGVFGAWLEVSLDGYKWFTFPCDIRLVSDDDIADQGTTTSRKNLNTSPPADDTTYNRAIYKHVPFDLARVRAINIPATSLTVTMKMVGK